MRGWLWLPGVLGVLLLWTGCRQQKETPAPIPEAVSVPQPLYFTPIVSGTEATIADTVETVIRDARTWDVWKQRLKWIEPPPRVDFDQAMLLLIALPAPRAGYRIQVESVVVEHDTVYVDYTVYEPASDCLIAEVQTVPFQVVMARRAELPVRFRREVRYESCEV